MSALEGWLAVLGLAFGTFLIRYSFIGLFANRDMPPWLEHGLRLIVPAIFAAIVASGVAIVGGQTAGWGEHWPRYAAALLALGVAVRFHGSVPLTLVSGMAALHGFGWLQRTLG
jgi:branched-subunit amino acid transport protein